MSVAPHSNTDIDRGQQNLPLVLGCFSEKDHGHHFEYAKNPEFVLFPDLSTGVNTEYPHLVYVGPFAETRMALVKGTVAYVVVDEIDTDRYVIEKWYIKAPRKYDTSWVRIPA